jgi:hypothetical protein
MYSKAENAITTSSFGVSCAACYIGHSNAPIVCEKRQIAKLTFIFKAIV